MGVKVIKTYIIKYELVVGRGGTTNALPSKPEQNTNFSIYQLIGNPTRMLIAINIESF